MEEVDIDRRKVCVTNIVKHFRREPREKLRLHKKPGMKEFHACRPSLEAELETTPERFSLITSKRSAQEPQLGIPLHEPLPNHPILYFHFRSSLSHDPIEMSS